MAEEHGEDRVANPVDVPGDPIQQIVGIGRLPVVEREQRLVLGPRGHHLAIGTFVEDDHGYAKLPL